MTRKEKIAYCVKAIEASDQSIIWAGRLARDLNVAPNILAEALRNLGWTKGYSRGSGKSEKVWRAPEAKTETKTDKECAEEAERAQRLASDYDLLRPSDFEYADADLNEGKRDKAWNKEKKQEFSRAMGVYRDELITGDLSESSARFIANLGEQERRHGNKRQARTVSLAAANEALYVRHFREAAQTYLQNKIEPAGYALKPKAPPPSNRDLVLELSDLHLGANLFKAEGNDPFGPYEEARRLEYIAQVVCNYKLRYRDKTRLILLLGGDMIEGNLQHDIRAGAPLIEQKVIFWKYFSAIIGLFAKHFPRVLVVGVPGNHGRDKLRHPGRATASKWDGHEWGLYYALSMMASHLKNVAWQIDLKPWATFKMAGGTGRIFHGDTDVKLGSPLSKGETNHNELVVANALGTYGDPADVIYVGHFHSAVAIPGEPYVIYNGMLVPSNNHAKGAGYTRRPCGQWMHESVDGYPVGDLRFIQVGPEQDKDPTLGDIVVPWRMDMTKENGGL